MPACSAWPADRPPTATSAGRLDGRPLTLHLADGGSVAGALADSDAPGVLRWRSPAFARPLDFPSTRVASVGFPSR